ncbi:M23 family metallopeptidase [Plantactinospora siamensis]|uniref:M23 family metallopeptidase n=1 Tax=Plantactinospora siamensis TaxID=555372 RepID=A0ABV6P583_9ACTN
MALLAALAAVAAAAAGCSGPDQPATSWATSPAAGTAGAAGPAVPTQPSASDSAGAGRSAASAASATPTPSPTGATGRYVFPVRTSNVDWHTTHHDYPATDIFAACGSPVVAVTSGTVLEVSRVDRYAKSGPQGPDNGGKSVSLLGDDGVRYYGSHLSRVADGLTGGTRVSAGQSLGAVGHTGNASGVCHLHFGISPPCARTGDWWIRRGVLWPSSFLDAWHRKANRSPADAVAAWQRTHGCPKAPR